MKRLPSFTIENAFQFSLGLTGRIYRVSTEFPNDFAEFQWLEPSFETIGVEFDWSAVSFNCFYRVLTLTINEPLSVSVCLSVCLSVLVCVLSRDWLRMVFFHAAADDDVVVLLLMLMLLLMLLMLMLLMLMLLLGPVGPRSQPKRQTESVSSLTTFD